MKDFFKQFTWYDVLDFVAGFFPFLMIVSSVVMFLYFVVTLDK